MSGKARVKEIKKIIGGSGNMNEMFEEMMGMRDADPDIIVPKLTRVRNLLRRIYRVLHQFATFSTMQTDYPETTAGMAEIKAFTERMKDSICISENEETENKYDAVEKKEVNELYKKLKDNTYVKQLIVLCSRLKQYHGCLADEKALKDSFIGQEPGLSLLIFDFSTLDLKKLWANNSLKPVVKRYILGILNKLYVDIQEMFKIITSSDVDIDKFSSLIMESIEKLKKIPELNRCKKAFAKIENSVSLLGDNFDVYYRDSVASANPNLIIESFIIDVSNQGGVDARLTREFGQIIQYLHKVSAQSGRNKDPNVQKLFNMLNHNFSLMEKGSKGEKLSNEDVTKLSDHALIASTIVEPVINDTNDREDEVPDLTAPLD